jgi:polyphenol oxidase
VNKRSTKSGVVFYTSDLLEAAGLRHGFFTRKGGVSEAPFDSLNLNLGIGDEDENVYQNRRKACNAIGLNASSLVFANGLVHGNRIYCVSKESEIRKNIDGFDALISSVATIPVGLAVADCLPIIITTPSLSDVAVSGVLGNTIKQMSNMSQEQTKDLLVAIGPGIDKDSYQVGADVISKIHNLGLATGEILYTHSSKTYCDIRSIATLQLKQLGVHKIDHIKIDTALHTDEFYSYRAEQAQTGRFGVIASI